MRCAICSRQLPEGVEECPDCFPPGWHNAGPDDASAAMASLIRKAKGWVLVGFAILPGWVAFPASFKCASDALAVYKKVGLNEPDIEFRIRRLRLLSGALSVVYWAGTVWWLAATCLGG